MNETELAQHFGADSVTYLSVEGMKAVSGQEVYAACFSGEYVVPISTEERRVINAQRRP